VQVSVDRSLLERAKFCASELGYSWSEWINEVLLRAVEPQEQFIAESSPYTRRVSFRLYVDGEEVPWHDRVFPHSDDPFDDQA
jgi:hypothetical protein